MFSIKEITNKKKVLIVEDDLELSTRIKNGLVYKYEVFQAEDGELAVEKFLTHVPDVIILDLLLPKLDGFKVLERLRRYPDKNISNIPVVVFSNLSSNKDILSVQALKVEGYFVKATTDLKEVYGKIDEIMAVRLKPAV